MDNLLNNLMKVAEAKPKESPFKAATSKEIKKRREDQPVFKCPKCGEEIERVDVVSKQYGKDAIDGSGHVGGSYDDFGGQTDILEIYCTECGDEITKEVTY